MFLRTKMLQIIFAVVANSETSLAVSNAMQVAPHLYIGVNVRKLVLCSYVYYLEIT